MAQTAPKIIANVVDQDVGGMPCPKCGTGSRVFDSRPGTSGSVRRRRVCTASACHHRFTTFEVAVDQAPKVDVVALADELTERLKAQQVLLQNVIELIGSARSVLTLREGRS